MRAAGRKKRRKRIRELLCKHKKKKQRLLKTRCPNQRHSNHWPSVALVATETKTRMRSPSPGIVLPVAQHTTGYLRQLYRDT